MKSRTFPAFLLTCSLAVLVFVVQYPAQTPTNANVAADRARAVALAKENRYLDAYPLLEKVSADFSKDPEVWAHYGIAIAIRSATLSDPKQRKQERLRALDVLTKARALGTEDVTALEILDQLSPDGGGEDNFLDSNPEVEKALREGEFHFAKGEYPQAFILFEKAFRLNPKSYEAAVFAGDTFYAQKKYKESEPWFAKAVAINPDREMAYRFWGDALLGQDKIKEAQEKFIDAFVAEPYSRYSWENINKLTRAYGKRFDVRGIFPPGTEGFGGITIDQTALSDSDGTKLWIKFLETRQLWRSSKFAKTFPNEQYRLTLKEVTESLRSVAEAASVAIKSGKIKDPHHSLVNLIDLNDSGFLEAYILLLAPSEGVAEDYESYRSTHRATLRKFLTQRVFVLEKDKS